MKGGISACCWTKGVHANLVLSHPGHTCSASCTARSQASQNVHKQHLQTKRASAEARPAPHPWQADASLEYTIVTASDPACRVSLVSSPGSLSGHGAAGSTASGGTMPTAAPRSEPALESTTLPSAWGLSVRPCAPRARLRTTADSTETGRSAASPSSTARALRLGPPPARPLGKHLALSRAAAPPLLVRADAAPCNVASAAAVAPPASSVTSPAPIAVATALASTVASDI